jgi:pyruvate,orthophosphate dikinase
MAFRLKITEDQCRKRIRAYSETNPMLGFRGIRLSIVHPEITEMQTKAIIGNSSMCVMKLQQIITCLCIHVYVYMCMCIYMCIYKSMYKHIYVYICGRY